MAASSSPIANPNVVIFIVCSPIVAEFLVILISSPVNLPSVSMFLSSRAEILAAYNPTVAERVARLVVFPATIKLVTIRSAAATAAVEAAPTAVLFAELIASS